MNSRGSTGRIHTGMLAALVILVLGCGRSVEPVGTGGSGAVGDSGASTTGGDTNAGGSSAALSGGTAGSVASAGGGGGGTAGSVASAGGGGFAGEDCKAIEQAAQKAADTSCEQDSDCEKPPYTAGDCTECGFVTNIASEQSSLDAVHSVCARFYAQGCQVPIHSCPAYRPACVAGVCE